MSRDLIKQKIAQAAGIMREQGVDLWLTFTRESSNIKDPMMDMIVGTNCVWQSAFMITKNGETYAIMGSLDCSSMKSAGTYDNIIGYVDSMKADFLRVLNYLKPKKIAINYSRSSCLADGLTHGMYIELMRLLEGSGFENRLISSENIIAALRGRKSEMEIAIMKEAIAETIEIFEATTGFLKVGATELEVSEKVKNLTESKGFGLSWEAEYCPSVFTGPDTAGAHAGPTDRKIEPGHVINMDFGINLKGYCSDLQRTWYVLRPGESEAPEEVRRGFNVIRDSIKLAKEAIKPGVTGLEIDGIARNFIAGKGYEEFPHALGHQVGRFAHDGGGLLAPQWDRYGELPNMPIEETQVYTIEPRLTIEGFGIATIEEEVLVTSDGCEFLSPTQEEIYLVNK